MKEWLIDLTYLIYNESYYIIAGVLVLTLIMLMIQMVRNRKKKKKETSVYSSLVEDGVDVTTLGEISPEVEMAKELALKTAMTKKGLEIEKEIEKEAKKLEKEKEITLETKGYHPLKAASKASVRYWKDYFKEKFFPHKTVLINMELLNGFHKLFLVKGKDAGFKFMGRKYIFDNESKYYCIDAKLWCFDYHENFVLPIKRKIPISDVKKALEASEISEVEYATNPSTLERFIVARIAEGIMKGQQLDEFMKQIRLLMIITMIAALAHLILFMFKTGMLQQIKVPFM